jgi:two-component system sensor histidine kinase UhpB
MQLPMLKRKPLRLLCIEDSSDDAELLCAELEAAGCELTFQRVETEEEMRAALALQSWDVVTSDYHLPNFSAEKALETLKEFDPEMPFIVVSGCVGEEVAVSLMKAGASDYVMKDRLARLAPAIERELREAEGRRAHARAEQALHDSESRLSHIMQALGDGILVCDYDGNLVTMNSEAERLLGWREDELVGHKIHQLVHGRKADGRPYPEEECPIRMVCQTMVAYRSESEVFVRRDGTAFPVAYVAAPFNIYDVAASVTVFRDITNRKKAEEELKASRRELRELSEFLQSVREDERTRIARELHDELGQMLTALKIDICWLGGKLAGGEENICAKLATMEKMIDQTVDSVRRISTDLRPWILDDLGLGAAIEWLVERFEQQSGIICEALVIDEEHWPTDERIATAIFRIVQEALTNITRHAEASQVMVEIIRLGNNFLVQVHDDGKGFDLEDSLKKKRFGLLGIRERVNMLGGQLYVVSRPGAGTSLHVRLPDNGVAREE